MNEKNNNNNKKQRQNQKLDMHPAIMQTVYRLVIGWPNIAVLLSLNGLYKTIEQNIFSPHAAQFFFSQNHLFRSLNFD